MFRRIISIFFVSIVAFTAQACAPKAEVSGDYPPPTPPAVAPADDNPGAPVAEPAHYAPASSEPNLGLPGNGSQEHNENTAGNLVEGQDIPGSSDGSGSSGQMQNAEAGAVQDHSSESAEQGQAANASAEQEQK